MLRSVEDPAAKGPPPLDPEDPADELSDEAVGTLLDPLPDLDRDGEEEEPDTEAEPLDLDFDDATNEDAGEAPLPVGDDTEQLLRIDEPAPLPDDDADGLPGLEAPSVEESAELITASDDADFTEELDLFPALAPLSVESDESEGVNEPEDLPELAAYGDEPAPPWSDAWVPLGAGLELESCTALAGAEGVLVAGSTDLLWFAAGELAPVRLEAGSTRIHALALVGTAWEYAVCATTGGKLFRRGRHASASEELRRWRDATDAPLLTREISALCQPGPSFPHALLLLTASGILLRSDDDGLSFRKITDRKMVALAPRGAPAVALTADGSLLRSEDAGGSFIEVALDELGHSIANGKKPLLAVAGDLVALADSELGLLISADRGASFRRVLGTRGVSALCAGRDLGEPIAFAALYNEGSDQAQLLSIDLHQASAKTIAVIEISQADEDIAESARCASLSWDEHHRRLWAAGDFGVKIFGPPA